MAAFRTLPLLLSCVLPACGARAPSSEPAPVVALAAASRPAELAPAENGSAPAASSREPWETRLVLGAEFELWPEIAIAGVPPERLLVRVTAVEDDGATRVYGLSWADDGAANGPTRVRVTGSEVVIGDAAIEEMQAPRPGLTPGMVCFAQDFSNPDGCDDVCDAELCFSPEGGIVRVGGLYAPNYMPYAAR